MADEMDPKDAEPIAPPSIKENPSATGTVADAEEAAEPSTADRE